MITTTYDDIEYAVPDLPYEITDWLDFMCEHYPSVMRELLAHRIGDLASWFSAPVNEIPTNGCLVGSAALMMSKVFASTCAAPAPSLKDATKGIAFNPRWSAAYYLTEFVSRCDPEYMLTDEEWKLLTRSRYSSVEEPSQFNIELLPPERRDVAERVTELFELSQRAGCAAPNYAEYLTEDANVPEYLTDRVTIRLFKDYIRRKLNV